MKIELTKKEWVLYEQIQKEIDSMMAYLSTLSREQRFQCTGNISILIRLALKRKWAVQSTLLPPISTKRPPRMSRKRQRVSSQKVSALKY